MEWLSDCYDLFSSINGFGSFSISAVCIGLIVFSGIRFFLRGIR